MQAITSSVAQEQSTYVVSVAFADEDGESVVPSSIAYSLVDADGNIINSLEDVTVTPGALVDIVLTGADLQLTAIEHAAGSARVVRYLVVEAVYDSDAGSGLTLKEEISFIVENLKKIA